MTSTTQQVEFFEEFLLAEHYAEVYRAAMTTACDAASSEGQIEAALSVAQHAAERAAVWGILLPNDLGRVWEAKAPF